MRTLLKMIPRFKKLVRCSNLVLAIAAIGLGAISCDQFVPKESTATIEVTAKPRDARITCDGVDYGNAPVTIENLEPGRHLLIARKDGYNEKRMTVNLMENQTSSQKLELEPITGLVLVESEPSGADVTIDDSFKGETPLLIDDIGIGTYRLHLYKESYFPREFTLKINDRVPQHVETELTSDSAALSIDSTPEGAKVKVNGSSVGETPYNMERVKTGEATVEITADGYMPYQQELNIKAGEEYNVDADLVPVPGGLTVYSVPEKANVYIDDERRGETPLSLTNLNVGTYDVRVEKKGYESQERSVDLSPGAKKVSEFRLESNSGKIMLETEPAGVKVYLDGEYVGRTEADENDVISETLEIDMVEQGTHRLNLQRKGYDYKPKRIKVRKNQVLSLHEKMNRLFIPDTVVRTGDGSGGTYQGILLRRHSNGDIELETRPGVIIKIERDEIKSIDSL